MEGKRFPSLVYESEIIMADEEFREAPVIPEVEIPEIEWNHTVDLAPRAKELDADVMRVALKSRQAKQAFAPIEEDLLTVEGRGLEAVQYKYGMHYGNWTDGFSDRLLAEILETLPVAILFMQNVKPSAVERHLVELAKKGVFPTLIFRPYFNPEPGINNDTVQDYADGVVILLRDGYLKVNNDGLPYYPNITKAYNEKRFVMKLFNELNIGGEGVPRGRAGFAAGLWAWRTARATVNAAYPKTLHVSVCNTPGNDDVYFKGDKVNDVYWYHGPEAAKENPTQAEINRAVQTAAMRQMFEEADFIGIHVYAQNEAQTKGNLATWYGRRHEQAIKFLQPYINAGKKIIISESDAGYDEPGDTQQRRAELFSWWLVNVVGKNPAIAFTILWWNSAGNEGAATWRKHETRNEDGSFRPIVGAVKNVRAGATLPDTGGGNQPGGGTTPPPTGGNTMETEVIFHGKPGEVMPDWIQIRKATARNPNLGPGSQYWRLKKLEVWSDHENDKHTIYIQEPHGNAVATVSNGQQSWPVPLNQKPAGEPAGNFPMWAGNIYTVDMGNDSDRVEGVKMPSNHHWRYDLWFEVATVPIPETTPTNQAAAFKRYAQSSQTIFPNEDSFLWKQAKRDGFTFPLYNEKEQKEGGITYMHLGVRNLDTKEERVYWVEKGKYDKPAQMTKIN